MTQVIRRRSEIAALRPPSGRTAVVMTMGALHEGHAALVRAGRKIVESSGHVIVTVFVNPRQFGAGEDFERYPRTLEDDVEIARSAGADVVFAPEVDEVYPPDGSPAASIALDPGPLGGELEGAARPGHFAGMLTVVAKLLHMTRPDVALFGEKDYQQLVLVRAMASALDFPVDIVGVPTVREADGLAMSSRNRYLSPTARDVAAAIPAALDAGRGARAAVALAARPAAGHAASGQRGVRHRGVVRGLFFVDPAAGQERGGQEHRGRRASHHASVPRSLS